MEKKKLPFKVDHSQYIKIILKALQASTVSAKVRDTIRNVLKDEYNRGYNQAVRTIESKHFIINDTNIELKDYVIERRRTVSIASHDLNSILSIMQNIGFDVFGIDSNIYNKSLRHRNIVDYHKSVYYILRECGITCTKIGKEFDKDHSTIVQAVKVFESLLERDKILAKKFQTFVILLRIELRSINFKLPLSVLIKSGIYNEKPIVRTV